MSRVQLAASTVADGEADALRGRVSVMGVLPSPGYL